MKLLVIPDVHGINDWLGKVADAILHSDTHVVFVGDYVDSYVQNGYDILENLKEIISFKLKYPDKITLLLGNHDYAYVFGKTAISGFNAAMWNDYRDVLMKNWDIFQMAWGYQGKEKYTLITHAGLCQSFYEKMIEYISEPDNVLHDILVTDGTIDWKNLPLHELINYFKEISSLMWHVGYYRGGRNRVGSILWADMHELENDPYVGINQIVGHTRLPSMYIKNTIHGDKLYFIDTHDEYAGTIAGFVIDLD